MQTGTKVICIADNWQPDNFFRDYRIDERFPKAGKKYTLRDIFEFSNGRIYVTLEEIQNPKRYKINHSEGTYITDVYFIIDAFREIEPQIESFEVVEEVLETV